jgi:hypothetical protein
MSCTAITLYVCCRLFRYRLSPETFGYTFVSVWKKSVAAYLKRYSSSRLDTSEEIHENRFRIGGIQPRFEPGTSPVQVNNITAVRLLYFAGCDSDAEHVVRGDS